jgi:hypothetical protein
MSRLLDDVDERVRKMTRKVSDMEEENIKLQLRRKDNN